MKYLYLLLFFPSLFSSQSDMKARVEFEYAEEAYVNKDYEKAADHLIETEKYLKKWTPKVSYLLIMALDKSLDYENPDPEKFKIYRNQITRYMQYAENSKDVPTEKFKEIYAIDENSKLQEKLVKEQQDIDFKKGLEFYNAKSYDEALPFFEKAAKKNNARAYLYLAFCYYYKNDYANAIENYKNAINKGDIEAYSQLAAMYRDGLGVEKDSNQYFVLNKKAAEKGYPYSMGVLASIYYRGDGVEKDYSQALYWAQKGEAKQSNISYYVLGIMYYTGNGVSKNENVAINYLKIPVSDNLNYATRALATVYLNKADYKSSAMYYLKCAENNDDDCMVDYANLHKLSKVTRDVPTMLNWYAKSAELGNTTAMRELVYMYRYGDYGVKKDKEKAKYWQAKLDAANAK